jgi:hypothetical protein
MGESDKSYLESRRIIDELKRISTSFRQYAFTNTLIWLVMILASVGLLVAEIVTTVETDWLDMEGKCFRNGTDPPFPLDLPFLFAFSVLVWILVLANVVGVFVVYMTTHKWGEDIFKVLPNLRIIYVIGTIASIPLALFDIFLLNDYMRENSCTRLGNRVIIQSVTVVTIFLTCIPLFLLLISCINNTAYYKRNCCKSCSFSEVIFFEFPFCRDRDERLQDEEEWEDLSAEQLRPLSSLIQTRTRIHAGDTLWATVST